MKHYIVISESAGASHKLDATRDSTVSMHNMTFPVVIGKFDSRYLIKTNLFHNKTFKAVVAEYKEKKDMHVEVYIMASFDLDETGEIMAEALKDSLVFAGVDKFDVFRVPLTEAGYVAVKEFSDTSKYKEFLYHQQRIGLALSNSNLQKLSVLKILSLKNIESFRGRKIEIRDNLVNINANGTSTITFVHKFINAVPGGISGAKKSTKGYQS